MRMAERFSKRRLVRNRRGGIMTLTALLLPALLLITGLAVDLGILYLAKTKSELAAISAADAVMARLPDEASAEVLARQVALAMLDDAGFVTGYEILTDIDSVDVAVTVRLESSTVFARFAGLDRLVAETRIERIR